MKLKNVGSQILKKNLNIKKISNTIGYVYWVLDQYPNFWIRCLHRGGIKKIGRKIRGVNFHFSMGLCLEHTFI